MPKRKPLKNSQSYVSKQTSKMTTKITETNAEIKITTGKENKQSHVHALLAQKQVQYQIGNQHGPNQRITYRFDETLAVAGVIVYRIKQPTVSA